MDCGHFDLFKRFAAQAFESVCLPPLGQDEVLNLDPAAVAQSRSTTEVVLELPHVARPRVRAKGLCGFRRKSLKSRARVSGYPGKQVLGNRLDVFFMFSEGAERAYES